MPYILLATELKIASYNVENLFDDVRDGSEYDDYIPGKHNWTVRMVEIKLNHTAEVLCELDADIVGLQEIENEAILVRLQKRLKRVGCPYQYHAITQKKSTNIHVALLSRYPIINQRDIRVNYSNRDRDILEATVKINDYPLTLFVNHWKAKSRGGKESRRIVYAKALSERINTFSKEKEYLILGDLNCHYDEYRVINRSLDDSHGKTGINHILKSIKGSDMLLEEDIIVEYDGHYNLWMESSPANRWSHKYYGRKGAIDHIMVPYRLFDGKGIDYVNNSFSVFKAPFLFTSKGWINAWDHSHGKHKGKGYSDHLPIFAYFSTDPYRKEKRKIASIKQIEDLYSVETLDQPVKLNRCHVILKRGDDAIIKQSAEGMAIYLYGAARALEEGKCYDLVVSEISSYKGLKEITRISQVQKQKSIDLQKYYLSQDALKSEDPTLQNQIFVNMTGIYRNKHLEIDGKKIAIYFKKKRDRPKEGSRLKIVYAHLGYYRKPQLVIYNQKDFIEEG